MEESKVEVLGNFYHHITNGGVTVSVTREFDTADKNDEGLNVLSFSFSHMGNEAKIKCWEFDANALRSMAKALTQAANKMSKGKKK